MITVEHEMLVLIPPLKEADFKINECLALGYEIVGYTQTTMAYTTGTVTTVILRRDTLSKDEPK